MNETLMDIVLETFIFLELTEDDYLDPDTAIEQMELVSFMLEKLSPTELDELVRFSRRRAVEERGLGERYKDRAEFLESMPEDMGWVANQDEEVG